MTNTEIKVGATVQVNNPNLIGMHGRTAKVVRTWNGGTHERAELKGGSLGWLKSIKCSDLIVK